MIFDSESSSSSAAFSLILLEGLSIEFDLFTSFVYNPDVNTLRGTENFFIVIYLCNGILGLIFLPTTIPSTTMSVLLYLDITLGFVFPELE